MAMIEIKYQKVKCGMTKSLHKKSASVSTWWSYGKKVQCLDFFRL